jgi:hypothetical protein
VTCEGGWDLRDAAGGWSSSGAGVQDDSRQGRVDRSGPPSAGVAGGGGLAARRRP